MKQRRWIKWNNLSTIQPNAAIPTDYSLSLQNSSKHFSTYRKWMLHTIEVICVIWRFVYTCYLYQSSRKVCNGFVHGEVVAWNVPYVCVARALQNEFPFQLRLRHSFKLCSYGSFQLICLHIVKAIKISWNNRVIVTCTWECSKEHTHKKQPQNSWNS